ncbi:hypothetical protein NXF25_012586 [Crotalus adamanteus]|uniref:Uncharacterized protein n=1 Tax=Crotalus adamanteus TaxID=8729 RepID=A0AAW1BDK0_CROAD
MNLGYIGLMYMKRHLVHQKQEGWQSL